MVSGTYQLRNLEDDHLQRTIKGSLLSVLTDEFAHDVSDEFDNGLPWLNKLVGVWRFCHSQAGSCQPHYALKADGLRPFVRHTTKVGVMRKGEQLAKVPSVNDLARWTTTGECKTHHVNHELDDSEYQELVAKDAAARREAFNTMKRFK